MRNKHSKFQNKFPKSLAPPENPALPEVQAYVSCKPEGSAFKMQGHCRCGWKTNTFKFVPVRPQDFYSPAEKAHAEMVDHVKIKRHTATKIYNLYKRKAE